MTGTASFSPTHSWATEQARWQDYYQRQIASRLNWAVEHVRHSQPSALRPHLDSLLTLLRRARPYPHLHSQMVALITALHPWPIRWLRWDTWEREIRFAVQVYADLRQPDHQAEFLSYLATLLFDTGRLDQALTVGDEALSIARACGAFIPLAIAGRTVVQVLLQYGRLDEARRKLAQLLVEVSEGDAVMGFGQRPQPTPSPSQRAHPTEETRPHPPFSPVRRRSPDRGAGFGQRPHPTEGTRPHPTEGARPHSPFSPVRRRSPDRGAGFGQRPHPTPSFSQSPHPTEGTRPHPTRTLATAHLALQQLTFLRRDSRMDEAINQASQIIAQLEAMSPIDKHLVAQAYRERSTMAWAAGGYPEAVRDIKHAIQIFAEQGDKFAATDARGNLGLIYCTMLELDRAEEEVHRLIVTAERLNARWHLTYAVDYLGLIALLRGERNRAIQHFDHAVDLAQRLGDVKAIHRIRSNRAVAWLYNGKPKAALPDLEADLKFSIAQNMAESILVDCICLSLCYLALDQRERALQFAEQAMAIAQQERKVSLRIMALRCLAEHRPKQRAELLQRARLLARQSRRSLDEAGCLLSLAGLAEDEDERLRLWEQGVHILKNIGATAWLEGAAPHNPPRVIILM